MDEWNKGELRFVCLSCGETIAKEQAEIRQQSYVEIFITCKKCRQANKVE